MTRRPQVPTPDGRFYITRDRAPDGTLAVCVEVWTVRPVMNRGNVEDENALAAWWLGEGDLALEFRWCTWSLAEAQRAIGNAVPNDERQCVVVGGARC